MVCPEDGRLTIRSLREADASHLPVFHGILEDVQVLGMAGKLTWSRDSEGLKVDLGDYRSDMPVVIKVTWR